MTMEANAPVLQADEPYASLLRAEKLVVIGRLDAAQALLAPLLDAFPGNFWVRRMQARATADTLSAMRLWHAQLLAFPHDAQSHIDLAQAVRALLHDDAMADEVLVSAQLRFADHLWVLDALGVSAERRGDMQEAAHWWREVVTHHPGHARGHAGLLAALTRLDARDELAQLEAQADPLDVATLRRMAEAAEPKLALDRWALLRGLHPHVADGHLGYVRTLQLLGRSEECNEILTAAQRLLPENSDIAVAWAADASRRGDWQAALLRARMLQQLLPDALETALIAGEALLETGDPAAAHAVLAPARQRFPEHFWLGHHEVRALNGLGLWHAAAKAGRVLFDRFPDEPFAGTGVAEALTQLGRGLEAEAILRQTRVAFPNEPWLAVRLAGAASARGDGLEAVGLWRAAGLPAAGSGVQQRLFAHALAQAGDPGGAMAVAQASGGSPNDQAVRRLGEAELLLAAGQRGDAMALWPALTGLFSVADPDFAALTWALATGPDDEPSSAMWRALLDEPDQDGPSWMPALGRAWPADEADGEPDEDRAAQVQACLRAALAAHPGPPTLARRIAESLTGVAPDPDSLAARMAEAVADGRPGIIALLLDGVDRSARMALRLAINRLLGPVAAFDAMPVAQVHALLLIARVVDPACLDYVAGLARPRFAAALPPSLPRLADVVGCIAHRRQGHERRANVADLPERLAIAVCVHGHATAGLPERSLPAALGVGGHDVSVFAHLWHVTTGSAPGLALGAEPAIARLSPGLRRALARFDPELARTLFPRLLERVPDDGTFNAASSDGRYGPATMVVEDANAPHLHGRSAVWRARYKVMRAHQMAVESGRSFDLVLHVAADAAVAVDPDFDWRRLAQAARTEGVVFADAPLRFHGRTILAMGGRVVAGAMPGMRVVADSFGVAEFVASGQAKVAGWPGGAIHRHSQTLMLHLMGVPVETLPIITPPAGTSAASLPPLPPAAALGRLWYDLKARGAVACDITVLRAAISDTTGGIAPW